MECPICLNKKSMKFLVELECHHKLCHTCAVEWLLKNPTCPCCRQTTKYFCKSTRSRLQARALVQDASSIWTQIRMLYGTAVPTDVFFEYIRYFFLQSPNRGLWYRPHLIRFKKQFMTICRSHPTNDHLAPHNKKILDEFLQSSV